MNNLIYQIKITPSKLSAALECKIGTPCLCEEVNSFEEMLGNSERLEFERNDPNTLTYIECFTQPILLIRDA